TPVFGRFAAGPCFWCVQCDNPTIMSEHSVREILCTYRRKYKRPWMDLDYSMLMTRMNFDTRLTEGWTQSATISHKMTSSRPPGRDPCNRTACLIVRVIGIHLLDLRLRGDDVIE